MLSGSGAPRCRSTARRRSWASATGASCDQAAEAAGPARRPAPMSSSASTDGAGPRAGRASCSSAAPESASRGSVARRAAAAERGGRVRRVGPGDAQRGERAARRLRRARTAVGARPTTCAALLRGSADRAAATAPGGAAPSWRVDDAQLLDAPSAALVLHLADDRRGVRPRHGAQRRCRCPTRSSRCGRTPDCDPAGAATRSTSEETADAAWRPRSARPVEQRALRWAARDAARATRSTLRELADRRRRRGALVADARLWRLERDAAVEPRRSSSSSAAVDGRARRADERRAVELLAIGEPLRAAPSSRRSRATEPLMARSRHAASSTVGYRARRRGAPRASAVRRGDPRVARRAARSQRAARARAGRAAGRAPRLRSTTRCASHAGCSTRASRSRRGSCSRPPGPPLSRPTPSWRHSLSRAAR